MATPNKSINSTLKATTFEGDLTLSMRGRMDDIEAEAKQLAARLEELNTEHQKLVNALNALSGKTKAKR